MDKRRILKEFVFNGMLIKDSLNDLKKQGIRVFEDKEDIDIDKSMEKDFNPKLWFAANQMASIYIALYCAENMLREFIVDRLSESYGVEWWDKCVPKKVKDEVQRLKSKEEKNKYSSNRSNSNIGYTMLGNLTQIIITNWDDFSDIIPTQAWITSRMDDLEMSRNVIMHTGVLPDIERERIESIVRDLVKQLG